MTDKDPNDFTVKQILTDFIIPQMKALDEKIELKSKEDDERFKALEAARNKMTGALLLVAAFMIPLSVPLISAVAQHKL